MLREISRNKIENIVTANTCSDKWAISTSSYVTTLFIVLLQLTTHHDRMSKNRRVELSRDRSIDISFELIAVVFDLSSCIRYANEYILFNKSRMFATGTYYAITY